MDEVKISIIVPVYNVEQYLVQCIESLINQSLKDIEIILINDGSRDGSLEILEKYKIQDTRIRVIDKENEGVSQTRNLGIMLAKAPYIMFVDADDWIDKDTCEETYKTMQHLNVDVVMWTYTREYKTQSLPRKIFEQDRVFDIKETKEFHRKLVGLIGKELVNPENFDSVVTVWGKLYKKEIILKNNIKFIDLKEIGMWEDGLFNVEYFGSIEKMAYVNQAFYHYVKTNASSITSKYRENIFENYQAIFSRIESYLDKESLAGEYRMALNNRKAMSLIGIGINECRAKNKTHLARIKFLKHVLSKNDYRESYRQLDIRYLAIPWKIFFLCVKCNCVGGVYILLQIIVGIIRR